MPPASHSRHVTMRPYLVGIVLALILTAIPFGLVAAQALPQGPTFAVIAVAAVLQVIVHLRFFLHLDLKPSSQENLITLCFAALLIVIMIGGSVWIMSNLDARMM